MVAVTIQGIASNERAGPFHFFCGLCFLRPPPPYFFRMRKYIFSYECVRLFTLFHTLCIMNAYSHGVYYPESGVAMFPSG